MRGRGHWRFWKSGRPGGKAVRRGLLGHESGPTVTRRKAAATTMDSCSNQTHRSVVLSPTQLPTLGFLTQRLQHRLFRQFRKLGATARIRYLGTNPQSEQYL